MNPESHPPEIQKRLKKLEDEKIKSEEMLNKLKTGSHQHRTYEGWKSKMNKLNERVKTIDLIVPTITETAEIYEKWIEGKICTMITPEYLHELYLEATTKLHPESFNPKAQKPFKKLTQEQKHIDIFIASSIIKKLKGESG